MITTGIIMLLPLFGQLDYFLRPKQTIKYKIGILNYCDLGIIFPLWVADAIS